MKKTIVLFFFLLLNTFTYSDTLNVFTSSLFYTNGAYNKDNNSNSYASYVVIGGGRYTTTLSYDALAISNPVWKYYQQFGTIGQIIDLYPVYLKLNYGHIKGDLIDRVFGYSYSDYLNLYSAEFIYTDYYLGYFGLSYTHENGIGYLQRKVDQYTLRYERYLSANMYLSIKPTHTAVNDGRSLFSISGKLNWYINPLLLKVGGVLGERAYYFDNDLLTIYNQEQTQKAMYFAQVEYPTKNFNFIVSYQHSNFNGYNINYYIAGIKTNLLELF